MCEQCQASGEEDDRDALAAAFYSTYGKAVPVEKSVPHKHAPPDRQAPPVAAAPAKKAAP